MICKSSDGLSIYYEVCGKSDAPETLVFLNGLTQSTQSWMLMLPYFEARYRIILLDFIFQGKSAKDADWRNFDQHANDVKRVLEQEGQRNVILVGLSYGSFVAQHFAVNHPSFLKKLVLISTIAHKNPYFEAIELSWERALQAGGYNLLLDIMLPSVLSEDYFNNPLIPIEIMKESRKELNQNTAALLKLMRATKERSDYRKELHHITAPTLIIQGEKDLLLPVNMANDVHLNIKGSRFVVIKGAGHTLNLEHVPEVSRNILEFIQRP